MDPMPYSPPPEGQVVPLEIVNAMIMVQPLKLVHDGVVVEVPTPCFEIDLMHVDPVYGQREEPFELSLPVHPVMTAFSFTPTSGPLGFVNTTGQTLLSAAGVELDLRDELPFTVSELVGRKVMGTIQHKTLADGGREWASVKDDYLHPVLKPVA